MNYVILFLFFTYLNFILKQLRVYLDLNLSLIRQAISVNQRAESLLVFNSMVGPSKWDSLNCAYLFKLRTILSSITINLISEFSI